MESGFPWDKSEITEQQYKRNNYKIIETGNKTGRALVFFSGNGLYYPNTVSCFEETIIKNDRYEGERIIRHTQVQKYYEKIVLVRDIYKQWYVKGINSEQDTVDKTIFF